MNIDNLTISEAKAIQALFANSNIAAEPTLNSMRGKKVIVRTYAAGVWFGVLAEKSGKEVILENARRMWRWKAKKSISLSACSIYGISHEDSKITGAVASVWLEAIEIIPCTQEAINSLTSAPEVEAV